MQTISLRSDRDRVVTFEGELLSSFEQQIQTAGDPIRTIAGRVFALANGGFVAEVTFDSDEPQEPGIVEVEQIDHFEDVDKFFYVLDLYESLCNHISGRAEQEACSSRAKRLEREYHKVLFPFLDELKKQVAERGLCDRLQNQQPNQGGFWDRFQTKKTSAK